MVQRKAKDALLRLSSQFPIIGITGPRQSGKTTLAKSTFPEKKYISFDDKSMREIAQSNPKDFLLAFPDGAIIDEAQKTHIINATAMLKKNQNQFLIEIVKNFNGGDEPLFYPGNILIFDKNVDKINEDDILYIKRTDHHGEIVINMPDNKSFIFLVVYSNDEDVNKQVTLKYTNDSKDIEILGKLVGVFNPMPKFKK